MLIICTHTVYSCTCTIQGTLNTRIYAHTCTYILVYMHHTTYTNTRTHAHIGAYILVHMHHTTYTRYSHRYAHTYMHIYTRIHAPYTIRQMLICIHIYTSYVCTMRDFPNTRMFAHICTYILVHIHHTRYTTYTYICTHMHTDAHRCTYIVV